jgi:acetyl-CoA carboxylase biotin carboxyl carrier protein
LSFQADRLPRLRIPRAERAVGHNLLVSEYKKQISELAELMEEFRLGEAQLQTSELRIAFKRRATARTVTLEAPELAQDASTIASDIVEETPEAPAPKGTPITSPMNGIFYGSPSPASPPFVKEGESVQAGQVVGLIEAMKVFNEIPTTVSGIVTKLVAETGALVQPGDVLLYIG